MRAVLRYRRIPFGFVLQFSREADGLPAAKVPLLPTFYLPDDSGEIVATTDSTPLIRRFERMFEGRSIIPPDPAMAFLDELLEDYADEWLSKVHVPLPLVPRRGCDEGPAHPAALGANGRQRRGDRAVPADVW